MKIDKIMYSPIFPVVIAGALLSIVLWHENFTLQSSRGEVANNLLSTKIDCSKLIPKNPYSEGTGEFAGFDWSMLDRGSRGCEAYNEPFINGCMEYVRQEKSYNNCLYNQSGIQIEAKPASPILLKTCSNKIGAYCLDGWNGSASISEEKKGYNLK